ncbi:MAG: aldo/keto reductase [Hyphomicrobiales bacterium]|nr:aldo/keto reductase [Hyphomicrobiales bacterium]MBV8827255.1 aldo/keto reductase [Hyphomicrobiales bacterium]MBV9426644.1 aldo/keto reductase [Bradyrhizobiaceae bacterium]
MIYRTFGRTGLKVSAAGLGGGGFSRLGLAKGKTEAEVVSLIHLALDLGVNIIDTAASYGTEEVIGRAINSRPRDGLVITTKASPAKYPSWELFTPENVVASIDNSLRQLQTDYLDVLQLHAVAPHIYEHTRDVIYPAVLREKQKGKIRFIGITEAAAYDLEHKMFQRALAEDDIWDTAMVAFNMMHQNVRTGVFPQTAEKKVGTLIMFAVRRIFAQPERLKQELGTLATEGLLPKWLADSPDPLDFLVHDGDPSSVIDAAYRFVRDEPGVDVVLFGTSDPHHLREDILSLTKPPLPTADRERIVTLFGHLVGVGIEAPKNVHSAVR